MPARWTSALSGSGLFQKKASVYLLLVDPYPYPWFIGSQALSFLREAFFPPPVLPTLPYPCTGWTLVKVVEKLF